MTENTPSSVRFGSRPRCCWMRAYSSGLSPCCATISGVIFSLMRARMIAAAAPDFDPALETGGGARAGPALVADHGAGRARQHLARPVAGGVVEVAVGRDRPGHRPVRVEERARAA